MKEELYQIIHTRNDWRGKSFDFIVEVIILLSVVIHAIETVPSMASHIHFFHQLEVFFLVLFSVEYILRIYSSYDKARFIFSFYGALDLLAILPGLFTLGIVDLRFLRILRLMRVFRALKLLRYSEALQRMLNAFKDIKEELVIFSVLSAMLLYISAAGIYYFEHQAQPQAFSSIPQSLWWAVATLTTVGYGDSYPITAGGKIFTTVILFIGMGIISVPSALLASALSKVNNEKHDLRASKQLKNLK
jgi:voltage-gated potassium channel